MDLVESLIAIADTDDLKKLAVALQPKKVSKAQVDSEFSKQYLND
jgi:hypothetical protein